MKPVETGDEISLSIVEPKETGLPRSCELCSGPIQMLKLIGRLTPRNIYRP